MPHRGDIDSLATRRAGARETNRAGNASQQVFGRSLAFVTTHLHHMNAEIRTRQVTRLNEVFGASDHPVILAGDLNAEPESRELETLSGTWAIASPDRALRTFPAGAPIKKIDFVHVLPRKSFRMLSESVPDEKVASDHRPLVVVELGAYWSLRTNTKQARRSPP